MPMMVPAWVSTARRAAPVSAFAKFNSSPVFPPSPVLARFSRIRTRFGAAFAIATSSATLSAPREPASTIAVTPVERQCAGGMSPVWT